MGGLACTHMGWSGAAGGRAVGAGRMEGWRGGSTDALLCTGYQFSAILCFQPFEEPRRSSNSPPTWPSRRPRVPAGLASILTPFDGVVSSLVGTPEFMAPDLLISASCGGTQAGDKAGWSRAGQSGAGRAKAGGAQTTSRAMIVSGRCTE